MWWNISGLFKVSTDMKWDTKFMIRSAVNVSTVLCCCFMKSWSYSETIYNTVTGNGTVTARQDRWIYGHPEIIHPDGSAYPHQKDSTHPSPGSQYKPWFLSLWYPIINLSSLSHHSVYRIMYIISTMLTLLDIKQVMQNTMLWELIATIRRWWTVVILTTRSHSQVVLSRIFHLCKRFWLPCSEIGHTSPYS